MGPPTGSSKSSVAGSGNSAFGITSVSGGPVPIPGERGVGGS